MKGYGTAVVGFMNTPIFDERLESGSFDVVMAFFVLHFFDDTEVAFQRIHDLLKPGGLFISETACISEKGEFAGKMVRFAGSLGLLPTINLLTTRQLEMALEKTGFRIVDKTRFSDRSDSEYTLFARKV